MRCAVHGLAAGPDRRCVICRRGSLPPTDGSKGKVYGLVAGLFLIALAGGAYGYVDLQKRSAALAQRESAPPPSITTVSEPAAENELEPELLAASEAPAPSVVTRPPAVVPAAPSLPAAASSQPAPPTEAEVARAAASVPVTIYTTSWCPACAKARAFFTDNGLRFVEHDIERDAAARNRMKTMNESRGHHPHD